MKLLCFMHAGSLVIMHNDIVGASSYSLDLQGNYTSAKICISSSANYISICNSVIVFLVNEWVFIASSCMQSAFTQIHSSSLCCTRV